MEHCPQCHSTAVRRTRTRSLVDRIRRTLTTKRPHRCRDCGWHGWASEEPPQTHQPVPIVAGTTPDFRAIDTALESAHQPLSAPSTSRVDGFQDR
jgi:hypothetical protein